MVPDYIFFFLFVLLNFLIIRVAFSVYGGNRGHIGKLSPVSPNRPVVSAFLAVFIPPSDGLFNLLCGDAGLHSAGAWHGDGMIQLPGLNSSPAEVSPEMEHGVVSAALDVGMGVEGIAADVDVDLSGFYRI